MRGTASHLPAAPTSKPAPGHKVYPYLLDGMEITGPNQVWAAITTSPWPEALYLVVITAASCGGAKPWTLISATKPWKKHWARESRRSSTPTKGASFQGFTELLGSTGSASAWMGKAGTPTTYSWSGCGGRSKYEEVYLKAYSRTEAKDGLEAYFHFYNTQRPHQALGYRTPAEVFSGHGAISSAKLYGNAFPGH